MKQRGKSVQSSGEFHASLDLIIWNGFKVTFLPISTIISKYKEG